MHLSILFRHQQISVSLLRDVQTIGSNYKDTFWIDILASIGELGIVHQKERDNSEKGQRFLKN